MKRVVLSFAVLYLIALLVLWGLIVFDQGNLWPITLFLFSPRWMAASPLFLLVPWTLYVRAKLAFIYILHLAIILIPISGFRFSMRTTVVAANQTAVRAMTGNLGAGPIDVKKLARLAILRDVDVMILQECASSTTQEILAELEWNHRQVGNMLICSPHKLGSEEIVARHTSSTYNPVAAFVCPLELPVDSSGESEPLVIQIVCVHLPTFRPAFERVRHFDRQSGTAIQERGVLYREIAASLQQHLLTLETPFVVAGDFNVPVDSAYYRDYWADYRNALDEVGFGYCYTKYTRMHGIRIDHVLCNANWTVKSAWVGPGLGGDHRPVITELLLDN